MDEDPTHTLTMGPTETVMDSIVDARCSSPAATAQLVANEHGDVDHARTTQVTPQELIGPLPRPVGLRPIREECTTEAGLAKCGLLWLVVVFFGS
jgi:hypothetical protein